MTKKESIEKCLNCALPKCTGNCAAFSVGMGRPEARKFPFRGEELTMRQISERTGVGLNALYQRITVMGWDVERAVSAPVKERPAARIVEAFGERHPLAVWASIRGISLGALNSRINNGWAPEKALTEPVRKAMKINVGGEALTVREIARRCGANECTIRKRAAMGWTGNRIMGYYSARQEAKKAENP